MSLFHFTDKTCCTCEHWEGPRANVHALHGRSLEGFMFCLGSRYGGCGVGVAETRPEQSCERWESLAEGG